MNDENTPPNARKRRSQIMADKKLKHAQDASTCNRNSQSFKSASFLSRDNIPQPMMVDSTSTNRRISLSELLNCKFESLQLLKSLLLLPL